MQTLKSASLAVGLLLAASAANANLLTNGSFETAAPGIIQPGSSGTTLQPGNASATYVAGWTAVASNNANVAWLADGDFGLAAEDGRDFIDLTGYTDSSPYAGIQQVVAGLTVGTRYKLTFYIGTGGGDSNSAYAGPASIVASLTTGAPGPSSTDSTTFTAPASAAWTSEELDFTAGASSLSLAFYGASSAGGQYIGLDNADLEAISAAPPSGTVPEPATLGLFGLGIVGLALVRRRQSR